MSGRKALEFRGARTTVIALIALCALFAGLAPIAGGEPLSSWASFVLETTRTAAPLLFSALSVTVAFRAGMFCIGAEGQMWVGALAATAVATHALPGVLPLALIAGVGAGAVLSLLACELRERRGVPELLSTLLLNFIVVQWVAYMVERGPLRERAGQLTQSDPIVAAAHLDAAFGAVSVSFLLALIAAFAVQHLLHRSAFGLRLRAAGEGEPAARLAGFSIARDRRFVFLIAGALAGLGGAVELLARTQRLLPEPFDGEGYLGVAVALVARLRPRRVVFAALGFAALETAIALARTDPDLALADGFERVVEAALVLGFLVFDAPRLREWWEKRRNGRSTERAA